ncbi:HigA family addiction module antitoxin [Leifsonia xyli]|nr:HigA family addiction module antitoxin [Leifsonia xyli]
MSASNDAVAPGEYLEEWLQEEGLSQQVVAGLLGCSRKQVNEIINGHAPITNDSAIRLERVVGREERFGDRLGLGRECSWR